MKKLRALFVIRSAEHLLRYESIITALASAGHTVTMLFGKEWSREKDLEPVKKFEKQFSNLSHGWLLARNDVWTPVLFTVRSLLTYRRYLTVEGQSSFFRDRWRAYLPFWLRLPILVPGVSRLLMTRFADTLLRRIEARTPADPRAVRQIREYAPDVLISPVGGIRVMSPNVEYLKAAVSLGIPTASPTVSWDTLTTKSLITVFPDAFLLWNEFHRKRATEHHAVPEEKIRVVGAPVFDAWFSGLKPSSSRTDFLKRYGLLADRPYLLYLGSAAGTAEDETWLIREIRASLDASGDPALRELQIMVRPHPSNAKVYRYFSVPGAVLAPKGSGTPEAELQQSFDTFFHAACVIGIFTSAMVEAQIVGKPVLIFLSEKYGKTQLEAQHFQDFIEGDSIEVVSTFSNLHTKLKEILGGTDPRKEKRRQFVARYVRPLGLERGAGEAAVREIEQLANI